CYACVAIDHAVSYANNVFMFQPDHCRPTFDVTVAPTAMIQLRDYPGDLAPTPSAQLPVFNTFRYPQERVRLSLCRRLASVFHRPRHRPAGRPSATSSRAWRLSRF
ncbi:MAG: hypothetical protein VXY81_05970, partial [Pseudomonadota bacterium]|nr:hypothetical protein [Pseudomonadota bacterium]